MSRQFFTDNKNHIFRMATIVKRQQQSFQYLEEVRQHLARLPSIDPNTRTLIICGFPNVGKSSFINKVTVHQHIYILSLTKYAITLMYCRLPEPTWKYSRMPSQLNHYMWVTRTTDIFDGRRVSVAFRTSTNNILSNRN